MDDGRSLAREKDDRHDTKFLERLRGTLDLGDMGQLATPANERRYPNEHLATVFDKTEAIARCMDSTATTPSGWPSPLPHEGYDCIPNPDAGRPPGSPDPRLASGVGFNIAPCGTAPSGRGYATADIRP